MPEQHLIPIALPRGRSGNTGYLTIYYAPRLKVPGILNAYPEWMRWPDTLNSLTIQIQLSDGVNSQWVTPTQVGISPSQQIWSNTFRANTPVSPHRFVDWSQTPLQTMPTSDFNDAILDMYARVAASHPEHPPSGDELLSLPETNVLTERGQALDKAVEFVQPMEETDKDKHLEAPAAPEWDFHQYISLLGGHPEVLRHLGIAVDYQIQIPPNITNPASVIVRTDYEILYGSSDARGVLVRSFTTDDFLAQPNPNTRYNEQEDGFLQLNKQDAYLSIMDTYSSATRLHRLDERIDATDAALPALTTRALTLVRPDLTTAFKNQSERQAEIEDAIWKQLYQGGGPVEVYAEDASNGYRLDVLHLSNPTGGTWRSLFERQTDADGYQFPHDTSLNLTPEPDEGWTQTVLVTDYDEQLPPPNPDNHDWIKPYALRRLDDQLYRWDGWSGAVRPPGSTFDSTNCAIADTGPNLPDPNDAVQFAANYQILPGTLPRLRFGETYQMRARCVDLAGNSVALNASTPGDAHTEDETFGRLEPIAAPFVVRSENRPNPGVGDDAINIVLLSDYDIDDSTVESQQRLMFPGRVGPDLCELHGEPNGGADPASYDILATRDAKSPTDQWSVDPATGEPVATGKPRQTVDYLSDPFIGQLRAYHYGEFQEYLVGLAGTWPDVTSSRLEVFAGEDTTQVTPTSDTELHFFVRKADIIPVDLSYAPKAGEVHQFGLWHRLTTEQQDLHKARIEHGGHWMFSARRPIRLIHAVRRPLLAPRVEKWSHNRDCDSTGITITTTLQVDRRSTGQLTLRARWTDLVDDLSQDAPVPQDGDAWLGRFTTSRDHDSLQYTVNAHRAELGDTKRHLATIGVEAFSSFSSYFTEERKVTVDPGQMVVDTRGFADGTVVVHYGADNSEAKLDVDYQVNYKTGVLTRTRGSALEPGSVINVRYVPLPVSRTSDEFPAFQVVLPNTATPPSPVVDSVIPAFARNRADDLHVTHDGRVVRVYLQRPWNITGDGESLAVLVERSPGDVPGATRLGRDPIVTGASTFTQLSINAISSADATAVSDDGLYDLALHQVNYDADSKRWYSDIIIENDAYRPFLQLMIARYQQDSIDGKRLGPAVTLEPLRLGVSRSLTITPVDDGYDINLTGIEHAGIPAADVNMSPLQNEVSVTLQQADPDIVDIDLRWLTDVQLIVLDRSTGPDGTTWSGHITVKQSDSPQRLVIEESEPALFGGEKPDLVGNVVYSEVMIL